MFCLDNLENCRGKLSVSLTFIPLKFGVLEFPARIYGETLIDPHEDMVVVDDFVGAGKDRDPFKGRFAFADFEFYHISPGLETVTAQDAADGYVCPHELVPHCLGHACQGGERPCMNQDCVSGIETNCPVVYITAFFYSEEVRKFLVGFNYVLRLGFHADRFSGHYFQEKSYGTVGPTAYPEAGGNLKAFQFFKKISFQKDTSR